ncbi:major facilitator superfamily domain-containing protein 10 isoform X2 [Pieris napi]|uniref:major facilitator superfamily domain-containing protein 10 isoform X2 n=1 Tax=Pieris napi TaxID=78633 RepID=UPI001FB9AC6E|nr:major facilitator superfamily domain-containing protein 10 isoform X2 [Pieris napi]
MEEVHTNGDLRKRKYDAHDANDISSLKKETKPEVTEYQPSNNKTIGLIFVSLLLDLLAFTMILPLLPSLLDYYDKEEGHKATLYSSLLNAVQRFQKITGAPERFASVLFGGALGSLYSFLQFLTSPIVGSLSDAYGRKPLLLLCLIGIALSHGLWSYASSFSLFVLARFIGGLSKANVSLSMAIVTDVSNDKNRARGMDKRSSLSLSLSKSLDYVSPWHLMRFSAVKNLTAKQSKVLYKLGLIYFIYLFTYSGLEFTLTFLTHHTFKYTAMQQGKMFLVIGVIMSVLQGGASRRLGARGAVRAAQLALVLTPLSFLCVAQAAVPRPALMSPLAWLWAGLVLFALSTAFAVSCMTSMAASHSPEDSRGAVLGTLRSLGALARAAGPLIASTVYWCSGAAVTYTIGAVILIIPAVMLCRLKT